MPWVSKALSNLPDSCAFVRRPEQTGSPHQTRSACNTGGTTLPRRNATDAPAQVLVALGLPHRAPYAKYVGYGGGFVHRDANSVEAAMAEYERDPRSYGRAAAGATRAVDTSHLELVGGFQDNGGPMLERPDGVVARFKNRGSSTEA